MLARGSVLFAVVGLVVLSFPPSARGDQPKGIAGLAAAGALVTMGCWTAALAEMSSDVESDDEAYARRGVLVGAGLSYAVATSESDLEVGRTNSGPHFQGNLSLKDSFGFKGRAGYRCHRYASAEVEVEWIDSFEGTAFPEVGQTGDFDVQPLVVTANARGYLPLWNDRIQPFVLGGGGVATIKTKENKIGARGHKNKRETEFAFRVGGGVDFYATPHIVLTLETDYMRPAGKLHNYDYVSIGLGMQYRF